MSNKVKAYAILAALSVAAAAVAVVLVAPIAEHIVERRIEPAQESHQAPRDIGAAAVTSATLFVIEREPSELGSYLSCTNGEGWEVADEDGNVFAGGPGPRAPAAFVRQASGEWNISPPTRSEAKAWAMQSGEGFWILQESGGE